MLVRTKAMALVALLMLGASSLRAETIAPNEPDYSPLTPPAVAQADGGRGGAGTVVEDIKFCAGAPDAGIRLRCFEDIATRLGIDVKPATGTAHADKAADLAWASQTNQNQDGSSNVLIALRSSDVLSGENAVSDDYAVLYLRCLAHQSNLYLNFPHPITPRNTQVFVSADGGKQVPYTWTPSSSGASIGVWNTADAAAIAKWFAQSSRISIKVMLPAGRSVTTIFEVGDLTRAMEPVRKACGW